MKKIYKLFENDLKIMKKKMMKLLMTNGFEKDGIEND